MKITDSNTGAHFVTFVYQIYVDQHVGMLEVEGQLLKTSRSYYYQIPSATNDKIILAGCQIQDSDSVFMLYDARKSPDFTFILGKANFRLMNFCLH